MCFECLTLERMLACCVISSRSMPEPSCDRSKRLYLQLRELVRAEQMAVWALVAFSLHFLSNVLWPNIAKIDAKRAHPSRNDAAADFVVDGSWRYRTLPLKWKISPDYRREEIDQSRSSYEAKSNTCVTDWCPEAMSTSVTKWTIIALLCWINLTRYVGGF